MRTPLPSPITSGEFPIIKTGHSFVYQVWAADGDLLYVGVTDSIVGRMAGHERNGSAWLSEVAAITWETYVQRDDAERVERHLIRTLQPKYNRAENALRVRASDLGHRRHHDEDAWVRLGEVIRRERTDARMTQTALAREARINVSNVRSLERHESAQYTADVLEQLERALGWRPGALETVLAGGEPEYLTDAELAERARAAAHARFAGAR
jgi:predicted GIY-YIG superfamily endonuclease